jgi:glycolate oxidase FAD binding subunit
MLAQALEPANAGAAADLLRRARDDRQNVRLTGGCTKLAWAGIDPAPLILSTKLLNAPIDHRSGDLTATLPAGVTLAEANAALMRGGQWLALDPPHAHRATIGGIVATNDSGPHRYKFGSPRDLIIGIELALVDGRTVKAGGHVVKNVAGYDLSRLMCGSYGSLALITSATFKLAPLAPASRTVVVTPRSPAGLRDVLRALAAASTTPSACDLIAPPAQLLIRFESTERAADEQASAVAEIAKRHSADADVISGDDERTLWQKAERSIWETSATVVRIGVLPVDVTATVELVDRVASSHHVDVRLGGRAALGVLFARFADPFSEHTAIIAELRRELSATRGYIVVLTTAASMDDAERSGELGDAAPMMRAVKRQFDPTGTLV